MAVSALAQQPAPQTQPQPQGQPQAQPEPPKWPDFAQVTKDMQPQQGLFTVYRYSAADNSKDQTRLLAQIPKALFKQDLLLATSISRGSQAGFQWDDFLIRFEMQGKLVLISVPDSRYITSPNQPISDSVSRTYNDSFLAALPIVTFNGQDPVVDLGAALLTPMVSVPGGNAWAGISGANPQFQPRRDLSSFDKVKTFPDNVLIDANLALAGRTGGGQSVGITYSFRRLPALGSYAPRIADERVGYFGTSRQDWATKYSEKENIVRYINRWDLKKKDSTLELSPPEKPIVFIIEKTVPYQWRKYVAEGIAEWNKAYEKLGIVGAIVVQQQTDDNEFANVDPEDARYNFFRWIVTGRGFAMGPSRADPRTGQILDADIIFDDSMLRYYFREAEIFGPAGAAALMGPEFTQFMIENPAFIPNGMTLEQVKQSGELMHDSHDGGAPMSDNALRRLNPARTGCNYAVGMRQHLAMMNFAAAAAGKKLPDKIIGDVIREVVAHEVGHTIGLRHNFKASSWLSETEIKRRRDNTDDATVASVMDYNPLHFYAGDEIEKLRHVITPCIGPYDYWAVEYGYRIPSKEDGDEKAMLGKITAQSTKREYAYATDEDTMGLVSVDPLTNRFDSSDDPVAWAKSRIALCDELMKNIRTWGVKGNEPRHYLRSAFMTVLNVKSNNLMYVGRLVGGQYFNRNRSGDPDAKSALTLVEVKRQRDALAMLEASVFKDEFFAFETELLNDLVPNRNWDWTGQPPSRIDFPAHSAFGSLQATALIPLTSPQVLQRVYDAELKTKAEDKFTAAELISRTRTAVWGNLSLNDGAKFTDAKPMLSSLKRNLQRQHVQFMLAIADTKPGSLVSADLHAMVCFSLRDLSEQIGKLVAQSNGRVDLATRAHLSETKTQIDRVLNAPYINMPGGGGGGIIIIGQPAK